MSDTERELLELAAKAAGISHETREARSDMGLLIAKHTNTKHRKHYDVWNPLHDDGAAMRLAVKLGMEIYVDTHPDGCSCSEAKSITYGENISQAIVNHNNDPYAATRRAIVRAAAEIGRSM